MEKNNKLRLIIVVIAIVILSILYFVGVMRCNGLSQKEENNNITEKQISFSEVMEILYPSFTIEENNCYNYAEASIHWSNHDNSECVRCGIKTYLGGISIDLNDTYKNKYENVMEDITGITGEVVSVKIVEFTDLSYPKEIYFLTRDGYVYYLNSESLEKNEYVAKKLTDISNVISIEKIGVPTGEHDSCAAIAITFEGERVLLSTEYNNINLK